MSLQLAPDGRLKHLLTIDGLPRKLIEDLLDAADSLRTVALRGNKKLPLLRGRTIINLFFEASTRTRTTFELAAERLSADVVNLDVASSSTSKGESLLDTLATLQAMHCDMFVVRHPDSGAAHFIAEHVSQRPVHLRRLDQCAKLSGCIILPFSPHALVRLDLLIRR